MDRKSQRSVAFVLLFGLLLLTFALGTYCELDFALEGQTTEAVVISREIYTPPVTPKCSYSRSGTIQPPPRPTAFAIEYRFFDNTGVRRTGQEYMPLRDPTAPSIGDKIGIEYLSSAPRVTRLSGPHDIHCVYIFIALVCVGFCIFYCDWRLSNQSRSPPRRISHTDRQQISI